MSHLPIAFADVLAARERLRPYLSPSPSRAYRTLDDEVGLGIRVVVKHENQMPTNAFKVRSNMSVVTSLSDEERRSGLVAATSGNHGLGLAWAGRAAGVPVTICVPCHNNPEKNADIRALGADLVETGRDYDEALETAKRLARERGLGLVHATNDPRIIAGAATLTLELLEAEPELDAMVVPVGGGSLSVGAITVASALRPALRIYGVQARGASSAHDSWHRGAPSPAPDVHTFADGLATRNVYEMTFEALRGGLAGFVTVTDAAIARALRILLRTTHNLAEGAGAAGLAGLFELRETLAGQRVGIVMSGGNIDAATLRRVITVEL